MATETFEERKRKILSEMSGVSSNYTSTTNNNSFEERKKSILSEMTYKPPKQEYVAPKFISPSEPLTPESQRLFSDAMKIQEANRLAQQLKKEVPSGMRASLAGLSALKEGYTSGAKVFNKYTPEEQQLIELTQKEYPKLTTAAEITGTIFSPLWKVAGVGAGLLGKGAKVLGIGTKAVSPIAKIAQAGAKEATTGMLAGTGEGIIRGETPEQTAKRALLYTGLGFGGGAAVKGIGVGIDAANRAVTRDIEKTFVSPLEGIGTLPSRTTPQQVMNQVVEDYLPKTPLLTSGERLALPEPAIRLGGERVSPTTLSGKLITENKAAINNLNSELLALKKKAGDDVFNATVDATNTFISGLNNPNSVAQNQLVTNNILQVIKKSYGVDIPSLVNKIQQTQKAFSGERSALARAAGAASERQYNLIDRLKTVKPAAYEPYNVVPDTRLPQMEYKVPYKYKKEAPFGSVNNDYQTSFLESIKTSKDLPADEMGLTKYIEEANKYLVNGKPINLQLFAEAQERLKTLKTRRMLEQRDIINNQYQGVEDMPSTVGKIVSSYENKPLLNKLKELPSKTYTRLVNTQHPFSIFTKAAGEVTPEANPALLASNARNAQGTINHILNEGLVNKEGKEIGESFGSIYKDIPKGKNVDFTGKQTDYESLLNDYMLHKHNIDRMNVTKDIKEYGKGKVPAEEIIQKPVFSKNFTPEMSQKAIDFYEQKYPGFKQLSERLNKTYDTFMKEWGVKGNLIPLDTYSMLKEMYPNYVPTFRKFSELEKGNLGIKGSGNKYINQSSGIKKATGSSRDIKNPLESFLSLVDKTVKAARNNEVGLSILNAIRKNPEGLKNFAEIVPTTQSAKSMIKNEGLEGFVEDIGNQFDKTFSKVKGDNIIRVMERGQPVEIKINNIEFLRSLRGLTESQPGNLEKIGRSITNPFKTVVTGKNPIFAVRNLSRDIPNAYINSVINNPIKFGADLVTAAKEMAANGKLWKEYKALGGEYSNFFSDAGKKLARQKSQLINGKNALQKAGDVLGGINSSTESLNRFAEYIRTVREGGGTYASKLQGVNNAAEISTNFARHGDITKSIDAFVPYLNASVQGLDKFARQIIKKPVKTIAKSLLAVTAPAAALYAINKNDPNYQQMDNRAKDTYYLVPKGDGTFIKIPKTREAGALFGALFERIARQVEGQANSFKGFGDTMATNFGPANPVSNNILSGYIDLKRNKDFANRTIVPQSMQDRSSRYQYDEKTSQIAKVIGNAFNLSPKQIDFLIKSYTGVIGQIGIPLTTKGGTPLKSVTTQFIADPLYSNQSVTDFYDNLDTLKQGAADKNFLENIPSKKVTDEEKLRNIFNTISTDISKVNKQINDINNQQIPQKQKDLLIRPLKQKVIDVTSQANIALQKKDLLKLKSLELQIKSKK